MSWNHRIVKRTIELGEETFASYALHEVYYDEDGKPGSWTLEPVAISGDTFDDTVAVYQQMAMAFWKPVLEIVDDKLVETEEMMA